MKNIFRVSLFFALSPLGAQMVESLASLDEIRPPLLQEKQNLLNATDSFGFEIQTRGFDVLFVTPEDGQAAHYSMQRGEFTNFFDPISAAGSTSRFAYHFGAETLFRMNGSVLDLIDRRSGQFERRSNPFGTPLASASSGDLLLGLNNLEIKAYSIERETVVYEKARPEGHVWIAMRQFGNRLFAIARGTLGSSSLSNEINDSILVCFDLTTGKTLFQKNVSLALLEHNPNARLDVIPFAADGGVVAIGGPRTLTLIDAFTGETIANHDLGNYVRSFDRGPGGVVGGYFARITGPQTTGSSLCGTIALGDDRIYLQNDHAQGSSSESPGISVFDFEFTHLFDIPNPYLATGEATPNDFGGTMALINDRLFIGNGRYLKNVTTSTESKVELPPRVHLATFTARDTGIHPLTTTAYLPETELEVSENSALTFDLILSRAEAEEVAIRVSPVFGTSFDFDHPATAVDDFPTSFQDIVFLPGETTKTLSFPIIDDLLVEENEGFFIVLSTLSTNVNVPQPVVPVTIISDDHDPTDLILVSELDTKVRYPAGQIGGIALTDEFIAVSVVNENKILFYDRTTYQFINESDGGAAGASRLGEVLAADGNLLAASAPGLPSDPGRVFLFQFDPVSGGTLLDSLPAPTPPSGTRGDFGRVLALSDDLLAIGSKLNPEGTSAEGEIHLFRRDSADSSLWTLEDTLTSPTPSRPDGTRSNVRYADDFDLGGGHLVVLHSRAEWILETGGPGPDLLTPSLAKIFLHPLDDLAGDPLVVPRPEDLNDILSSDLITAGPDDFVVIDGDSVKHTLARYSYTGTLLSTDDQQAEGQISEAAISNSVYNGHVSLRALKLTRHLDAYFPADGSTADYSFGDPFVRFVNTTLVGYSSRGGRDRNRGAGTAILAISPPPDTGYPNSLLTSLGPDQLALASNGGDPGSPGIYQLPSSRWVSVLPTTINEGDTPETSRGEVTFELSAAAPETVTAFFEIIGETATLPAIGGSPIGSDIVTRRGSVVFSPGLTTATAEIQLRADDLVEGTETFQVMITRVIGAGLRDRISTVTIIDDEGPEDLPLISVSGASWNEASNFTGQISNGVPLIDDPEFTFTLSEISDQDVFVEYHLKSESAIFADRLQQLGFASIAEQSRFGKDYTTPRFGRDSNGDFSFDLDTPRFAYHLVIPAGETSATVRVPVANDDLPELEEVITLRVTDAENARFLPDTTADLTLIDDDLSGGGIATLEILPTAIAGATFGADLAVDQKLVVGNQSTSVIISDPDGSNQVALTPPTSSFTFGDPVATLGNFVVAGDYFRGNGFAYLYETDGTLLGDLTPTTPLALSSRARYGRGVALARSGATTAAIVSASSSEQVYVFDANTGAELRVFSLPAANDYAVSISAEGSQVLVGTEGEGAYLYDWTDGSLLHHFEADDNGSDFGETILLEGDFVFVGGQDSRVTGGNGSAGLISAYDRTTFAKRFDLLAGLSNEIGFGEDVALLDGRIAVDGFFGVYLYDPADGTFLQNFDAGRTITAQGDFLYVSDGSRVTRYDFSSSDPLVGFSLWQSLNSIVEVNGQTLFNDSQLSSLLAYSLGLDDTSSASLKARARPALVSQGSSPGLAARFQIPDQIPPNIRLEIFASTTLEPSGWQCIAIRQGNQPWTIMRPSQFLPTDTPGFKTLQFPTPATPQSYYRIEATLVSP